MVKIKYLLFLATWLFLSSCKSEGVNMISKDATELDVIKLGLTASSSHNAQPWKISKDGDESYTVLSVKDRWLPEVDPNNRELLISMGILIGTLNKSAKALGFDFNFTLIANSPKDRVIGTFTLSRNYSEPDIKGINTLKSIYSEKGKYTSEPLELYFDNENVKYYKKGSNEFIWLKYSSIDANIQQANRDNVQQELAHYFCFSKNDKKRGLGITPEMIRLPGIMQPIWYLAFDEKFIMSNAFRDGTATKVKDQIENSSGFITISSSDNSVKGLIDCGVLYQSTLYELRSKDIEAHPISQILEEDPWKGEIGSELKVYKPVQMILRVGKYKKRKVNYETNVITSASIRAPFEAVYSN